MWVPKWYIEALIRKADNLDRRLKRLELLAYKEAENKIASLRDLKAGSVDKDGDDAVLTIEEIINKRTNV